MKAARITAQRVVNMGQPEFDRLMERAGRNPSMAKILQTARKDMTPPRRPKGEKPATTIRVLNRQIRNLHDTVAAVRLACADKDKVIAGYDVQLSEAQETSHRIARAAMARREKHAEQMQKARVDATRLAFLEGYYAKSQETARAISAARAPFLCDPTETYPGGRPRDPQDLPAGGQAAESPGSDQGPSGFGAGSGDEIRSEPPHDRAHPDRRPMEHITIRDGKIRHHFGPWPE